jgi:hypothetical protein
MVFVWALSPHSYLASCLRFAGQRAETGGTVLRVEPTGLTVNEHKVYAYHFEFQAADGRAYQGISYGRRGFCDPPAAATVRYKPGDPGASRIVGLRTTPAGAVSLLALLLPAVGVGMLVPGLCKARKGIRLLRDGMLAAGRLLGFQATTLRVNNKTVYKFTFEYQDDDGQTHRAVARTHETQRFAGEPDLSAPPAAERDRTDHDPTAVLEPLVYDPLSPSRAVLLDELPGGPRIDDRGHIRADKPARLLLSLIVPAAAIFGHCGYAASLLLRAAAC